MTDLKEQSSPQASQPAPEEQVYEVVDTPEAKTAVAIAFLEQFRDGRIEAAQAARHKVSILGSPEALEIDAAIFAHAVDILRAYGGMKEERDRWWNAAQDRQIEINELERYKQALQRANGFLIMHELEPVKLEYIRSLP